MISIHAPRVGSDFQFFEVILWQLLFQSTLPVWGATGSDIYVVRKLVKFQSTLPVWGATRDVVFMDTVSPDFNPRSPCGERP